MRDSYQPIFDAVRSRISNGDISFAVENVLREANLSHYIEQIAHSISYDIGAAAQAYSVPSAIYRPTLSIDGDKWCALYGENLQNGVAGFGDSPADAIADFNAAWDRKLTPSTQSADELLSSLGFPSIRGQA